MGGLPERGSPALGKGLSLNVASLDSELASLRPSKRAVEQSPWPAGIYLQKSIRQSSILRTVGSWLWSPREWDRSYLSLLLTACVTA